MTARSISRSVAVPFARGIVGRLAIEIWTPAKLFAAGQQGVWLEASPTYKGQQVLWQQSDGTVIVDANGDPVGRDDDLSPNGNNAIQATSAYRPTYNTDGTRHWFAHDGVEDYLRSENGINASVDEFWLFFAGEHAGGSDVVVSLSESGANFQYLRIDKTQIFVRSESSAANQVTAAITGTDTTAVWSIRARKSDRTVTVWRNRVQEAQVTAPGTDWFPELFYLHTSGGKAGASTAATVGRGYVWVLDALSATAVAETEDYLADRAGITL